MAWNQFIKKIKDKKGIETNKQLDLLNIGLEEIIIKNFIGYNFQLVGCWFAEVGEKTFVIITVISNIKFY